MGLFSKKVCSICGGEIGMLGNRKLEDGNLCKNCASKLSPFYADRRGSTIEDIRKHLAWREQNERNLDAVRPNRVLGSRTKIYLDDANSVFFVTAARSWREASPDVLPLSAVIDCTGDVREHSTEVYHRDRDGKNVPFNPPRYEYTYEFDIELTLNWPWYSQIRFELTDDRPTRRHSPEYREWEARMQEIIEAMKPAPAAEAKPDLSSFAAVIAQKMAEKNGTAPAPQPAAQPAPADDGSWTCACGAVNTGNFCPNCGARRPVKIVCRCSRCGWQSEPLDAPMKFCPNCGDPFSDQEVR